MEIQITVPIFHPTITKQQAEYFAIQMCERIQNLLDQTKYNQEYSTIFKIIPSGTKGEQS